ncbi:MAG: hypothetical protein RR749_16770 [Comamonas sp.]|jgi:hypothetical protein
MAQSPEKKALRHKDTAHALNDKRWEPQRLSVRGDKQGCMAHSSVD